LIVTIPWEINSIEIVEHLKSIGCDIEKVHYNI